MLDYPLRELLCTIIWGKVIQQFQMIWKIMNECFPAVPYNQLQLSSGLLPISTLQPLSAQRVTSPEHREGLLLTPPKFTPCFAFSLTTQFISVSICFRCMTVQVWFSKCSLKFLFFSMAVDPWDSSIASFCMTEMPRFIIHSCCWVKFLKTF